MIFFLWCSLFAIGVSLFGIGFTGLVLNWSSVSQPVVVTVLVLLTLFYLGWFYLVLIVYSFAWNHSYVRTPRLHCCQANEYEELY